MQCRDQCAVAFLFSSIDDIKKVRKFGILFLFQKQANDMAKELNKAYT